MVTLVRIRENSGQIIHESVYQTADQSLHLMVICPAAECIVAKGSLRSLPADKSHTDTKTGAAVQ